MNNNQLENLLKITAERLGTTPQALKNAAQKGDMGKILGSVPEGRTNTLESVVWNSRTSLAGSFRVTPSPVR